MTSAEWHATAMKFAEEYAAECVVADAQTGHGDKESAQLAISLAVRARAALSAHLLAYPVGADIDAARARVAASGKPTLQELRDKFSGWDGPELSGKVFMRNPKESA